MRFRWFLTAVAVIMLAVGAAQAQLAWYDSKGFESPTFRPGVLNGQDGWVSAGGGVSGDTARVITAPEPVVHGQAVRLEVGDSQGDHSLMFREIADPLAAGWPVVIVSFDIYRIGPHHRQNLWWYWIDSGEPTYGIQWDISNATHPFGWNPGASSTPTIFDRYVNLKMVWDFSQMKAYSWYNGVLVDNGIPISGISSLTGWGILLAHDAPSGTGAEVVWIDNFAIHVVPEPASFVVLAGGALALASMRRRRA
ncbi:MAG: PEP-CTERM sorting domain-containing protein [Armatimonadota bacterium]|nr:VPLPA-CTERM sorting domain-containing protein [bacterium]MDW8322448.1 PEP-CTERM sorting domain-containing protein [Armatimonadota bacterium]